MKKLIKFSEQTKVKNLIPVHINKCRCDNYFWNWSNDLGDWIRAEKISDKLKQAYKNPMVRSNYI